MSAFSLKWPPVRYFAWLLNKNPLCSCRYIMYVTLTDLQNGEPVYLTRPLSGGLKVALCELTYYHQFYNISDVLKNIQIRNGPTTTPDGYYNVCELDNFFQLLNAELTLHTAVYGETSEFIRDIKQRAGKTPWVFSRDIPTRQRIHRGQATQTCCLSGDLCAPR